MKSIVEPIRDKKKIKAVEEYLEKHNKRNKVIFIFGINTGLRISDILALNVGDVRGKTHIEIREKKTSKFKKFPINSKLKIILKDFISGREDSEPLFMSNRYNRLDRSQVYRMLNDAFCTMPDTS